MFGPENPLNAVDTSEGLPPEVEEMDADPDVKTANEELGEDDLPMAA